MQTGIYQGKGLYVMDMSSHNDQDTQRAWNGWAAFTRMTTISVIGAVVILSLMALILV